MNNYRRGLLAEKISAALLRLKGYRILARRLRTPLGEVDLLARRGRTLVLVEVKAREKDAEAALGPRQQARLTRAASHILAGPYARQGDTVRFDLIALGPSLWPRHVKDAFREF